MFATIVTTLCVSSRRICFLARHAITAAIASLRGALTLVLARAIGTIRTVAMLVGKQRAELMADALTRLAKGRECQVRLQSVCNFDPSTTVLAHIRMIGISGLGTKANSLLGAWCCSACHDAIDRRAHLDLERDYVRLAHYEGVIRTQAALIREGVVKA